MPTRLHLKYRSGGDFMKHLEEQSTQGALLVPSPGEGVDVGQFEALELEVEIPDMSPARPLKAEVLQVIPSLGLVVKLDDPLIAATLAGGAASVADGQKPTVTRVPDSEAPDGIEGQARAEGEAEEPEVKPTARERRAGSGPLSWPFEKLLNEWSTLTVPEKVRVAKFGKRPARGMILRLQDKMLHNVLMSNPRLTPDEVAAMAGKVNLDPTLLRRIASSQDWTRHKSVVRNLVCHPKLSIPQVQKLLSALPASELSRLTRAGKVRASVKQVIVKHLERRR